MSHELARARHFILGGAWPLCSHEQEHPLGKWLPWMSFAEQMLLPKGDKRPKDVRFHTSQAPPAYLPSETSWT